MFLSLAVATLASRSLPRRNRSSSRTATASSGSAARWSSASSATATGKRRCSPRTPDKKITFRNLGWSGDTVLGEARGRFDFDNAGRSASSSSSSLTLELKPTVIFVSYGTNESFEGEAGCRSSRRGWRSCSTRSSPRTRGSCCSRRCRSQTSPVTARPASREQEPRAVRDAIKTRRRRTRASRSSTCSTVLARPSFAQRRPLTDNGMHLTEDGYQLTTASRSSRALGLAHARTRDWKQLEPLRQAVVAKNELFFHRWRPQNETYLFGFRKHEQGKNAKEIAEFDPLVAKAEEEIDEAAEDAEIAKGHASRPLRGASGSPSVLRQPVAPCERLPTSSPCAIPPRLLLALSRRPRSPSANAKMPDPDPELERQDVHRRRRVRGQPLRRRPAARQADPDELRPAGPALGRVERDLPADQAGREGQRQDHRPRRHRRRRQGRQDHRLRRRPAHPHRRRARRRRGLRRQQHRARPPLGVASRAARPTRSASCSPASAPRTRTTSSTRSAGARTAGCTSTSRSTSTATSRRRTASSG